jgi:pyruvate formate lyase activating enzyme
MGLVFDIQHYAIHDGPGIRTIVFMKGCPLDCPWCHNPESKSVKPEFMWWHDKCIGCKACVSACSQGAIDFKTSLKIDENKCVGCGNCVNACYSEALESIGKNMTVDEVMDEISKDSIFYEESGGGVTFSGGEPLIQPSFLYDLLVACKSKNIHTAVETCGYANSDVVLRIKDYVDLFLYDIKIMDESLHEKFTGVKNQLILDNLKLLKGKDVVIRVPLIPGVNDDLVQIQFLGDFISKLGFKALDILPYHKAGSEKLKRLNTSKTPFYISEAPSENLINNVIHFLEKFNLKVKIGG